MGDPGRDELVAVWARVEGELRAVLASVEVSDEVRERVLEFLDPNEFEVRRCEWAPRSGAKFDVFDLVPDRVRVANL